jgi:hypothetical protein
MRKRMLDRPSRPWNMTFVGGLEIVDLREWICDRDVPEWDVAQS